MEDTYETKDLGCATYLYSKKVKLISHKKNGNIVHFTFKADDGESAEEIVNGFYGNSEVPVMDFWQALKTLKMIIHDRS